MNGDDKEEAHRPRPLSGGLWTLFSWLRRSDRSSSNESLSSVGSARTAVSFDFLAPGNCNFTNTTTVFTAQFGPPSETYKKRLQDRNLRLQRDRDITLHRKYGLFRENGNGYDGFSLPPTRRAVANSVDRPSRERRATSECLQRRAAYVPGKRRAPLPPAFVTSASLPRCYKRKRPAPKPPIVQEKIAEKEIKHFTSMNLGSDGILPPDLELLMHSTKEKNDKKSPKAKTDKSFLKHIFENKKRNSAIETPSLRLLPSISELDKQAAEIVENNKLRQSSNSSIFINAENSKTSYEGNSWFCTSCLRKYNSSINSCNNCNSDKIHHTRAEKQSDITSPRNPSTHTETQNAGPARFCQSNTDERTKLKEILKEMKDSLPKKNRENNNKLNILETETPTLRIGSSGLDKYKGETSQPISSNDGRCYDVSTGNVEMPPSNRIFTISSLFSERQTNLNEASNSNNNHVTQHEVTISNLQSHANKTTIKSLSPIFSERNEEKNILLRKEQNNETDTNDVYFEMRTENTNVKTNKVKLDEIKSATNNMQNNKHSGRKELDNKSNATLLLQQNINTTNTGESSLPQSSTNKSHGLECSSNKPFAVNTISQIQQNTGNNQSQSLLNLAKTHVPNELKQAQPLISKEKKSNNILVSNETVVMSHNNIGASKTSSSDKIENQSLNPSTSKSSHGHDIANAHFTESHNRVTTNKSLNVDFKSHFEINANKLKYLNSNDNNKAVSNLHTPLKISSLFNTPYSPPLPVITENQIQMQANFDDLKNIGVPKTDNKEIACLLTSPNLESGLAKAENNKRAESTKIVAEGTDPINKYEIAKPNMVLPSTSSNNKSNSISWSDFHKLPKHDRRIQLIRQLEQSMAGGDEIAAAEAAVELAKLRQKCSILAFLSPPSGEPLTQSEKVPEKSPQSRTPKMPLTEKKVDQNINRAETAALKSNNNILNKDATETPKNLLVDKSVDLNVVNKESHLNNKPSSSHQGVTGDIAPIDVWIEDKQTVRGPIRLRISRRATMADLRLQAEHSLGLATHLQRWIVGKTLCSDDSTMLVSLAGSDLQAPFYVCVVQSDDKEKIQAVKLVSKEPEVDQQNHSNEFYTELMKLEQQSLVKNLEPFECGICMEECPAGEGVVLRECIHTFCRQCLSDVVQHCEEPVVSCPATGCTGVLQEREIRSIVSPEGYERWLARSLSTAECGTRNTFHCRTPDCTGWAFYDPGARRFPCPVCKHTNCVQCQAIHEGETCEQHQIKLREAVAAAETYKDDEGTQALLSSLIAQGEALECPECKAIITKKWGCDWIKCSACKTEICWVTKGRRWGPGGRGDTSGGCRCGVDGQRCHPSCSYCH